LQRTAFALPAWAICEAAGTTPTTFYRYFSSKSDIARLLQDHINVDVKSTFDRLDEVKRPTKQAIRGWLDQYDQMWQRNHVLCEAFGKRPASIRNSPPSWFQSRIA